MYDGGCCLVYDVVVVVLPEVGLGGLAYGVESIPGAV